MESYRLQIEEIIRWQILEYEGIPFQCSRCHEVGHLYKDFPLIMKVHIGPLRIFVTMGTQIISDVESTPALNIYEEP